jgi:spore coat polysaccharide biosynthesis protein SpsF (cytidylyltransferase family)
MKPINGRPLLGILIDRVKQSKHINSIVVATSVNKNNDIIETFCANEGIHCFRGSEDDVAGRMLGALESEGADIGVEIYGDGPLNDPRLIDECIEYYLNDGTYDLVGNDMKATYPSGMYSETFSVKAFKDSTERTSDPAIREHGTLYLRQHPDLYKTINIEADGKLNRSDIHLDVDTKYDFDIIEAIVKNFAPRNDFSLSEILDFLDANPLLAKSNQHTERRWKQYQRT